MTMMMTMRRILTAGSWQRHSKTTLYSSSSRSGLVLSQPLNTAVVSSRTSPSSSQRIVVRRFASSPYASPTPPRCFPVKAIEVLSLGGDDNSSNSSASSKKRVVGTGRLTKILHHVDSLVEAGNVVAEITTTGTGVVVPVATPQAGKITQILYNVNDSISVGDVLFHIDTDHQQRQQQQSLVPVLQEELLTHLKENNGMITDAKMKEWMSNNNSMQHMLAMAKVMRDLSHLPLAVRAKGLDLLQHVLLQIQQQQQTKQPATAGVVAVATTTPSTTTIIRAATVHMELGLFNAELSYWDAATLHLNHALALLKQQQQQNDNGRVDKERMALCHAHLAKIARQRDDIDGCIHAYQQALELQQAILQKVTTPAATLVNNNMDKNGRQDEEQETASAAVAATYHNLAAIYYEKGDYNAAIQYYNLGIQERIKYIDNDGEKTTTRRRKKVSDLAGSYSRLAMAMKQTGDLNGALLMSQRALQLHAQQQKDNNKENADSIDDDSSDMAVSHEVMGIILSVMGQFEAALEQYRAACKIHEEINMAHNNKSSLSSSRIVATMYNKIGNVYYQMKDYNQALVEHEKALDILNQADVAAVAAPANAAPVPPVLIRELANTYNHIGLVLLRLRGGSITQGTNDDDNKRVDLEKALEAHQTARRMLEQILGKDHPQLAMTVGSLGNALQEQGKLEEALSAYREAHALLVRQQQSEQQQTASSSKSSSSLDIAASHNNIGLVLARLGDYEAALVEYRAAKQVFTDTLGSLHAHTASCHFNIGLTLLSNQQKSSSVTSGASDGTLSVTPAAIEEFDMARAIWATELGRDHPQTLMAAKYVEDLSASARR